MAQAAADPAVQRQLQPVDDDALIVGLVVALVWIVMVAGIVVAMLVVQHAAAAGAHGELARRFAEEPGQGGWPERIGIITGGVICALPGVVLLARVLKLRRAPLTRALVAITAAEKRGIGVTRLDVVDVNGAATSLTPRMKAFLESTGGGLKAGVIGVASMRGDQLTDWHAISG